MQNCPVTDKLNSDTDLVKITRDHVYGFRYKDSLSSFVINLACIVDIDLP